MATGCSDAKIDSVVKKIFEPRRTPQQYMLVAVSDADPDIRRDAVARVARSKHSDREWTIKGYIAIAELESDPQARCVAIRALAATGDPRAVQTALKILNYREHPASEVQPPDELCRWDATVALADLTAGGCVPEELRRKVCQTLLDRLRNDTNRHARIAAARGLGHFAEPHCVRGLIDGLRDEDFAVAHECEQSLVRLTGVTHGCSALAWEDWLEANQAQLFAGAGHIPEQRRPPYTNRWGKLAYNTKQFLRWIFPGKKIED